MKIKITEIQKQNDFMEDTHYTLKVNGKSMIEIFNMDDCPEDAILSRGLSFVFNVIELMKMAYNAGKNFEKLEIESIIDKEE